MRATSMLAILQAVTIGPIVPSPDPIATGPDWHRECSESRANEIVVCKRAQPNSSPRLPSVAAPPHNHLIDDNGRFRLDLSDKAAIGGGGPKGSVGLAFKLRF